MPQPHHTRAGAQACTLSTLVPVAAFLSYVGTIGILAVTVGDLSGACPYTTAWGFRLGVTSATGAASNNMSAASTSRVEPEHPAPATREPLTSAASWQELDGIMAFYRRNLRSVDIQRCSAKPLAFPV